MREEDFTYAPRLFLGAECASARRGLYRPEKLGMAGSSKTAYFWVYDAHTMEAAQGMAWEMLLAEAERSYGTREEVRFP